jgi:2-polyprenyl-3-methyl-5-hydroxy-6-metoxy-1,4-benzoquinol methylase
MAEDKQKSDKIWDYHKNTREKMLKFIPQDVRTTLEFGCGCGNFSELIKNKYHAECWGVEINSQAAKKASERLHKVINADAHQALSEIPENYFDCIVFNDVLEHLADPYSLLTDIKSKLKSSGIVVTSIPNVRFWNNLKALTVHGQWDYKDSGILDKTHLRFFTYNSLVKMFKQLDYDVLTIEGLRPTRSIKFKIINALFFNRLRDAKFHQFACIVKPRPIVAVQYQIP